MGYAMFSAAERTPSYAMFELGQSKTGQWVLREANGLGFAIFRTRAAAEHYALIESGGHHDAVISKPEGLEPSFALTCHAKG